MSNPKYLDGGEAFPDDDVFGAQCVLCGGEKEAEDAQEGEVYPEDGLINFCDKCQGELGDAVSNCYTALNVAATNEANNRWVGLEKEKLIFIAHAMDDYNNAPARFLLEVLEQMMGEKLYPNDPG